jgi:zinc/manganese transport system permease protein
VTVFDGTGLSWNLADDLRQLLAYHFMVNAFAAGAAVAVMCAVVGWFTVLRRQAFAAHTLSLIAFPGAAAAVLAGVPTAWGYFGFCTLGALGLSAAGGGPAPRARSAENAATGTLQALVLASGFLFVSLSHQVLNGPASLLFGTFLGIDDARVAALAVIAAVAVLVVAIAARPLLFASLDPEVAAARGVPVRALSIGFLVLVGLGVAAAAQITGSLLVFTLLVTPAATAETLTAHPGRSFALTLGLALAVTWLALAIAYFSPYPIGFWITTLSFAAFAAARAWRAWTGRAGRRWRPSAGPTSPEVLLS